MTTTLLPGIPFTAVPGVTFVVPPHTDVTVPAGPTYLFANTPGVQINMDFPTPVDPRNEVKRLNSTVVQLVALTKGVITVSGGRIIFDPWQITRFPTPAGGLLEVNMNTPIPLELKDGRQRIGEPTNVLKVPYRHFTLSVNSIPFRYRSRKVLSDTVHTTGTVTTAFSLALSFGHSWGFSEITTRARNDYSFTLGGFVGPSSVELKKETVKTPNMFVPGRTNPILSYGLNAIFARNGFGLLLSVGWDNAYGKFGNDWVYDKEVWYGFGISASFPK